MWETEAAEAKSRRCCPTEARELLAMLHGPAVPQLYPYRPPYRLGREQAIELQRGLVKHARLCRDEAIERAEVIRLIASAGTPRSAAISLGIEASTLDAAVKKARDHWNSRRRLPAVLGRAPIDPDGDAWDAAFQLRASDFRPKEGTQVHR